MQAVALSSQEALARLAAEHGVGADADALSRELLCSVMRSQLARMYPCPPTALLTATRHAMEWLTQDGDALGRIVADVLEDLQTCGDIVELARVTCAQDGDRSQWLFPAPPSFVLRSGRAYLFGIAPDNAPFLPAELWRDVLLNGATRSLEVGDANALMPQALMAFGLRQLDEREWLGAERTETAAQHVELLRERLRRNGANGPLPGMKVLAHQGPARQSYQRRWATESMASGLHVARMEQPHGAPLWYLADLNAGRCQRSLLLPFHLEPERACDQAWRAQLAIDALQGHAGRYTVQAQGDEVVLTLDFPIPLVARRRLQLLGGSPVQGDNPNVFSLPQSEEQAERRYLEEHLWLQAATAK